MARIFPKFIALLFGVVAAAQSISLTTAGSAYTQNFNTLSNTAGSTTNNLTITGWFMTETGGGARDNEQYAVDTGGSNTGDTYSYGAAGNTDRALGGLRSGTLIPVFGASFTNNTGVTITSLNIAYTGEQWRLGTASRTDQINFEYSTNAADLATGTWTGVAALNFVTPTTATTGAKDGNAAANRSALSTTITGLSIPNGATFWIRWTDVDATSADDGLAVDDFSLTPNAAPTLPNLSINDVSLAEGNSGTTNFVFTVSLSAPAGPGGVTFDIATADNTAVQPGDYSATSLTGQTIPAGSSTYSFNVSVNGDTAVEPNETFFVNVTNVTGANVLDAQGQGTINNDDVSLTSINLIQGNGNSSPLVGATVTTRGIVTAVASNGFYMQNADSDADADPATSEGILVFTSSAPPAAAAVGNFVQVTGTVTEFTPGADPNSRPLTEITSPVVVQLSAGNALPAAVIVNGTLTPGGGPDQWERFEGMRVQLNGLTVVAPTDGNVNEQNATSTSTGVFYAVFTGTSMPFREAGIEVLDTKPTCAAGSGCAIPTFDANPERIRIDSDAITGMAAFNVGTGNTIDQMTGVMTYGFRAYTVLPTSSFTFGGTAVSATPLPTPGAGTVTVATMNLERFFDTADEPGIGDPVLNPAAYDRRLSKVSQAIRNYLRTPDVVALEEVENLTAAQDLATRISNDALGAGQPDPQYSAYLVEGNDPGGIDVAFLVKTGINVSSVVQLGKATQYTTPCASSETLNDRPPLKLTGSATKAGQTLPFTIFVNHLRSLNGIDEGTLCNDAPRVRAKRAAQAAFLAQQIQDELTNNPAARIIAVGDFNAFEVNDGYVDVLGGITGTPAPNTQVVTAVSDPGYPDLTNMVSLLPFSQRYSYVFDGNHQTLDHVLMNPAARANLVGGGYARINADFPETARAQTSVERFSDHDPAMVYLTTAENITSQLQVARGGIIYNRTALTATGSVIVRNSSAAPISGTALNLVISALPGGVQITNATANNGAAYVFALPATLAPGQSVTVPISFSMTSVQAINYVTTVFKGTL